MKEEWRARERKRAKDGMHGWLNGWMQGEEKALESTLK